MPEALAVLLLFLVITFGVIALVGLVLLHRQKARELLSRERLVALEKGVDIPWESHALRPRRASRVSLIVGLVLVGAGIGLASASPFVAGRSNDAALAWAVFLFAVGVANLVHDHLHGRAEWQRTSRLEEAMAEAYIGRLRGGARSADDRSAEGRDAG